MTLAEIPRPDVLMQQAVMERVKTHLRFHKAEKVALDKIHDYLLGKQDHPAVPRGEPTEVKRLALMSRVNILELIVSSVAQAMYVDGYRSANQQEESPVWEIWQANRMDARQAGIHRGALSYGASYVTVLPGEPLPVMRGYSPRRMSVLYGDDDEWPVSALQIQPEGTQNWRLRLFDERQIHVLRAQASVTGLDENATITLVGSSPHGQRVTPVVRFRNLIDLDEDFQGEIERLMPIQDQIDVTTFSLLVAQQYAAFRQRWIIGWTTEDENKRLSAAASRLWTFEDSPDDMKIGEFEQTDLKGYLDSREASLRHAATISQTPAHELIGQMINLSAEALVAAEASQRRKVVERQMSFGESWEQVLGLAGVLARVDADAEAQVRWRDTESRALSQTVDALGKMAQMLNIPPQELWERIPGVTQQDVERWKVTFEQSNALNNLTTMLERQMGNGDEV